MSSPQKYELKIAVVGGGITGLAAAHRLLELNPRLQVSLFEGSSRIGGVMETTLREDCIVEGGPDGFCVDPPDALDLARRVGLEDELATTDPAKQQVFVVHRGRLEPVPPGFTTMTPTRLWPVLSTRILSLSGKARLACEPLIRPKRDDADESLESFSSRRLGRETFERLIQPLVGGIYTADPALLSVQATMPRVIEWERRYGSLMRGARHEAQASHATSLRRAAFLSPRHGMASLPKAIAARLPEGTIRLNCPVQRIAAVTGHRWSLVAGDSRVIEVDGVILCNPAPRAAQLVRGVDRDLSALLQRIPYASCAIVSLAYDASQVGHPLDGSGLVVPLIERRNILSVSFASSKYRARCPKGKVLFRVFIGGACQAGLIDLSRSQLEWLAAEECRELLKIDGQPRWTHVSRRGEALPQYHLGHKRLIEQIESRVILWPSLALAGNAYHGAGIPQCVHSGEQAAERMVAALGSSTTLSTSNPKHEGAHACHDISR
jgi:oxygen-dependent protoporphyrinogen oxidase